LGELAQHLLQVPVEGRVDDEEGEHLAQRDAVLPAGGDEKVGSLAVEDSGGLR
jgi:hypothetical protein